MLYSRRRRSSGWPRATRAAGRGGAPRARPGGRSGVLIVADEPAAPVLCAADLLAQAEHGPGSDALLVTTDGMLADAVAELVDGGARVELVASLDEALARADDYAPEHLQLVVRDPQRAAGGGA